jgi:hypothetical protein
MSKGGLANHFCVCPQDDGLCHWRTRPIHGSSKIARTYNQHPGPYTVSNYYSSSLVFVSMENERFIGQNPKANPATKGVSLEAKACREFRPR